ncbi:hypothetical protein HPB48_010543 [Haemaphysalis longicornis]|uniref:Uncharacterized protein n=1 Tax=Haemaphysalis longicornis TaxID=44386 RepID=A0A9J6H4Y8_HAELO|nr:hypothetical protein HPB48_010543 [Haemaphysalis longicornis]
MSPTVTTPTVAKKSKRTHYTAQPYTGDEQRDPECTPFGEGPFQLWVLLTTMVDNGVYFIKDILFGLSSREMDHWCRRPAEFDHMSAGAWKQFAIPRSANGSYSRCTVRYPPDGGLSTRVVACTAWEFNLSEYGNTVVSEWSLVCHRAYLRNVASLVNSAAMILALPVAGAAADHVGHKTVSFVVREMARFNGQPRRDRSMIPRTHLKKSVWQGRKGTVPMFLRCHSRRIFLIAFVWHVIGWTHSHYTAALGTPVSRPVSVGMSLLLLPMFWLAWPFLVIIFCVMFCKYKFFLHLS